MKKIFIKSLYVTGLIIALNACVGKSKYECYFPPQSMRFCILDSTKTPSESWINKSNKDSLHLYSVKEGVLTPISFSIDTFHFKHPVIFSYAIASLVTAEDSTKRINEFRLYGSPSLQSPYQTIHVYIKKTLYEGCTVYVYQTPDLNGRDMNLDSTSSFWVGLIKND